MNAKKALLWVGGIVVVLVGAIVTVALYVIGRLEKDRNRDRTANARAVRHLPTTKEEISPAEQNGAMELLLPKTDQSNEKELDK